MNPSSGDGLELPWSLSPISSYVTGAAVLAISGIG